MLAHQNSGMRVVQQIAGEVRQLRKNLPGDIGVPLRGDKNSQTRRREERRDELPCHGCSPRPSHDPRVRRYAQKLVEDRPAGVPGIGPCPLAFKPVATGRMKLRVGIRCIHQDIGIDSEHYRPSIA